MEFQDITITISTKKLTLEKQNVEIDIFRNSSVNFSELLSVLVVKTRTQFISISSIFWAHIARLVQKKTRPFATTALPQINCTAAQKQGKDR